MNSEVVKMFKKKKETIRLLKQKIEDQQELLDQRKIENEELIKKIKEVYREAEFGSVLHKNVNPYESLRKIKSMTSRVYQTHISFLDDILKKGEFKK